MVHKLVILIGCILAAMNHGVHAQDNYEIKSFQLEGVKHVSESALREALSTKAGPWYNRFLLWRDDPLFSVEEFQRDLQRITKFYEREGFFHVRVADSKIISDHEKQQVRLWVKIEENEPARISEIKLAGVNPDLELPRVDQLFRKLTFKVGDRLHEAGLRSNQVALATDLANHGYPYAQVRSEIKRDAANKTAKVIFRIDPGAWCTIGNIQITGNDKIPQRIIREELPFRPGEVFNQGKLIEGQQQIYRLELFQSVSIRAMPGHNDNQVPVEVRVREAPLRTLKVGAGYGTEELFRATINFRRRNFLGGARRLESEVKYSDIEPGRIQARIFQPHFIDSKSVLILSPFFFRQAEKVGTPTGREPVYELQSYGGELTAQRQLSTYNNGFVRYRLEKVKVDTFQIARGDTIPGSYRKSIWGIGAVYNSSRPLFSPNRGRFSSLQIDYSGPLSDIQYVKATLEGRIYREVEPGWVMAYRLKLGSLEVLEKDKVAPIEERFYAGGSSSVRGWSRLQLGPEDKGKPTGGKSLLEGSVESRFQIIDHLGAALFLDFGNVGNRSLTYQMQMLQSKQIKLSKLHYAAGLGLRYDTPIGPIRIDAAAKINKQPSDKRTWEFYLSVGQAF
jgi:outer membrane protein insertion porin family